MTGPDVGELLGLRGRCAIVTGAAQGFGAAIAGRLSEAGAVVVVADQNADGAEIRAAALASAGGRAVADHVDVTDQRGVEALLAAARSHTGRVDILVNNAGVFSNFLVSAMPPEEFERILRVNVLGSFICAQAVSRLMREDGHGGVIVNVASVDALRPSAEGLSHYTTSKHAIAGLTRSLAMELAPHGIRVNAVCPGAAMTEGAIALIREGAPEGIDVESQWDGIVDRTPLGRLCTPDDVGRAVLFLASDMAAFVTGVLLPVDGGILVQPLEGYVPATSSAEGGSHD